MAKYIDGTKAYGSVLIGLVILMTVRGVMKNVLILAVAVAAVSVAHPNAVQAQGLSEWGQWDGPRRMRPPPPVERPQYDDAYSDEEYFEEQDARRRRGQRYEQRWQDDDGAYDPRYDRRYDQRDGDRYENYDDQVEGAPSQLPRGPDGKPIGKDGGPQPIVQATAPPIVAFSAQYAPGSIVIDTGARKLYFVRGSMSAFAYPIGVGREGFSWTGTEKVSRVADWPDWYPPAEMRKRKPELPERMLGGLNNPLGAKAIYLGNTLYRIHGTNDPKSIGRAESSGCFRMLNAHVMHLASLVQVGANVTVVRSLGSGPAKVADVKSTPKMEAQPQPRYPAQPQRNPRVEWSADPDPRATEFDDNDYR
jgi:lipoprotein-anchoring transpeptidase ErfK/SrfK